MSDNLFGDLDVASAADDPFSVKPGTYGATLTSVSREESKKGNKGLVFEYTINDGGEMDGRKVSEWKTIPSDPNTAEGQRSLSFIKMRLASLGVPESRMNTVAPEDMQGTDVVIEVVEKDGFTNVKRLTLAE